MTQLEQIHAELHAELEHAQQIQAHYHNARHSSGPELQPDQLVWLLQ
jgi:hypothetical protein